MSLRGLYLERLIHGGAYFRNFTVLCLGVRFMHILPPPASTVDNIPCRVPHSNILSVQPLFVKRTTSLPRYFTKRSFK